MPSVQNLSCVQTLFQPVYGEKEHRYGHDNVRKFESLIVSDFLNSKA
jgi:hypothetical protein